MTPGLEQWHEPDGPVLTRTPAGQVRWWEAFGDPVPTRLVETACQENNNPRIAGLRVPSDCPHRKSVMREPFCANSTSTPRAIRWATRN